MIEKRTYKQWYDLYLAFFAGIMIAFPKLVGIAILPILMFVIYGLVKDKVQFKFSWMALLLMLLYLSYLIGTLYTDDPNLANKYLEYKLSFVVFPLLLSFRPKKEDFSLPIISTGLIIGVAVTMIYGVANSLLCSMNEGTSCFLTVIISPVHHPTYFVSFILLGMVASWIGYQKKWKGYKLFWIIPFTLFALTIQVLSLSLAGILFLMITISVVFLNVIIKRWGKLIAAVSVLVFVILGYLTVNYVPQIEGEWNNAKWYANEYVKNPSKFVSGRTNPMSGTEQRLVMWTVAWEELKENPMGAGTGNVDIVLGNRLRKLGQFELAAKELNPHNQFLQTGIEVGVSGLLILLMLIGYGIFKALRNRNGLLLLIIAGLAFNSLFESMLQRQSGIVFFSFWICLLMVSESLKHEE